MMVQTVAMRTCQSHQSKFVCFFVTSVGLYCCGCNLHLGCGRARTTLGGTRAAQGSVVMAERCIGTCSLAGDRRASVQSSSQYNGMGRKESPLSTKSEGQVHENLS